MRAALAVVALAALAGCAAPHAVEPARRTLVAPAHVTLDDQDARIELAPGARIHVRLESEKLLVARRRWHITAIEGATLAPIGNPWYAQRYAYSATEHGNWIFDFDAVAEGETTVTFDFRRDNEPPGAAVRTASFHFFVH